MANAVEQSSSTATTQYGYSALPAAAADTSTTGHNIDTLYPADVYERLVAVSATHTLCMSPTLCRSGLIV